MSSLEGLDKEIREFLDCYKGLIGDANGKISGELVPNETVGSGMNLDNCVVIRLRRPLPRLAHNRMTLLFRTT